MFPVFRKKKNKGFQFFNISKEEISKLSSHGDHQSLEDYDPAHYTFSSFTPLQFYFLLGFLFNFCLFIFISTPFRFNFTDFFIIFYFVFFFFQFLMVHLQ